MTNVVESALTEVLVEEALGLTLQVVDGQPETIEELATELVYAVEPQTTVLETAEQGPVGPAGTAISYPAKTLVYDAGVLTEVLSYLDAAKTILGERRVLNYSNGALASVQFYDAWGALTKTRTLVYTDGVLSGYTE